ncbi:HIT domain-containing protein [uncultured Maritalea sp.]|uniref:HIT domain-containing protein n=1 Tax=uncultured Maritalea sp. TaxID=757249 RepID=UPI00262816DF|nr:HIT domain-containing protein [uncultured Maritalea sp.]
MNQTPLSEFPLNPRLAADTHFVTSLELCNVLLVNDARFVWLILVPRIEGAIEVFHLDELQKVQLATEIDQISGVVLDLTNCEKLNVGALGNIVRQLHVHIIAREISDAAWPGPVWGVGTAKPYSAEAKSTLLKKIKSRL